MGPHLFFALGSTVLVHVAVRSTAHQYLRTVCGQAVTCHLGSCLTIFAGWLQAFGGRRQNCLKASSQGPSRQELDQVLLLSLCIAQTTWEDNMHLPDMPTSAVWSGTVVCQLGISMKTHFTQGYLLLHPKHLSHQQDACMAPMFPKQETETMPQSLAYLNYPNAAWQSRSRSFRPRRICMQAREEAADTYHSRRL